MLVWMRMPKGVQEGYINCVGLDSGEEGSARGGCMIRVWIQVLARKGNDLGKRHCAPSGTNKNDQYKKVIVQKPTTTRLHDPFGTRGLAGL